MFKQYIPQKRVRFGIKLFSLCEECGYWYNSFLYLGKDATLTEEEEEMQKEIGKSGAIVVKLVKNVIGSG